MRPEEEDTELGVSDTVASAEVPQTDKGDEGERRRAWARARIARRLFDRRERSANEEIVEALSPEKLQPAALPTIETSTYVVVDELARGGLGRILRARDTRTGRIVAIKEMLYSTEDATLRFVREAMVTANLQHPCIVPVYELGKWSSGQPFYAMRLVRGQPLDVVIDRAQAIDGRLALVTHVAAVADALAYAHGQRVIHRDLKPHNVICGAHGETVVIDWGLARPLDEADAAALPRPADVAPGHTHVGAVMGTPCYMPPEQAHGERVDERADVYSIGAILYHVLAGVPPFYGETGVVERVKAGPPAALRRLAPSAPADLLAIAERAMARTREDRYPSAGELATDLRRFMNGQLVRAHVYTRRERLRRFVGRHRAAVAITAAALVALSVVGAVSITNIVAAKREAVAASARADSERDKTQRQLVAQYVDRARVELATKHPERALAFAAAAVDAGTTDPTARFMIERALEALPPIARTTGDIGAAVFVPNSHDLAIGGASGVWRWTPDTQKRAWHVPGDAGEIVGLDDATLAAAFTDGLSLIAFDTGAIVARIPAHAPQTLLGYLGGDRKRRWLAAPSADGVVDLFDTRARTLSASVPVKGVKEARLVSEDGERMVVELPAPPLASGGVAVSRLAIVDRAGKQLAALCTNCIEVQHSGDEIAFAKWTGDERPQRVAIADWNGAVRLDVTLETNSNVEHIATDLAHQRFALVMVDGTLEVRNLSNGALVWRLRLADRAYEVQFDDQGRLWALGNYGGETLYDATTGVELQHFDVAGERLLLSADRTKAAVIGINPPRVATWPLGTPTATLVAPTRARVRKLVFTSDGRIITGSDDGTVALLEDGRYRTLASFDGKRVSALRLLADDTTLVVGIPTATALLDIRSGATLATLPAGLRAEPSPDNATIATGGEDGVVALWRRATGAKLRELGRFPQRLMTVTWSRDGRLIGAIDGAGAVKVWTRDGTLVREIAAGKRGVDIAFSHDGRWLARSMFGGKYMLFALDGGADRELPIAPQQQYMAEFSANDQWLLTAGSGHVTVVDTRTAEIATAIQTNTDTVFVKLSADGSLIFGAGIDHVLRVWDARTGSEVMSLRAPDEVYGIIPDPTNTRFAILTLGPALLWNAGSYDGNPDDLRKLAACRTGYEVAGGELRQRPGRCP